MKRKREMEKRSEIRSAIEELSMIAKAQPAAATAGDIVNFDAIAAHIPTKPFLHVCTMILQVLDKIGPTMTVLRQDIHQNIQRLEILCESDATKYSNLIEILKKEESEGNARKGNSCSKAILWLTRSMDFMVALFQRLVKDPGQNIEQAVQESYNVTLKPRHGWIASAAFKMTGSEAEIRNHCYYLDHHCFILHIVALKLMPDNKTFVSLLMTKDQNYDNLKEDMQILITLLVPLLEQMHSILKFYRLDRLKST